MKYFKYFLHTFLALFITMECSLFSADFPQIAVDSNGNIAGAWTTFLESNLIVEAIIKLNGTGFGSPTQISYGNPSTGWVKVLAQANGLDISVAVLWTEHNVDHTSLYSAMLTSSDSKWSSPKQISDVKEHVVSSSYQTVIDCFGNVVAIWTTRDMSTGKSTITSSISSGFSNSWSPPLTIGQ